MATTWNPADWRAREARHQPPWPDQAAVDGVVTELKTWPPLVFAGEARTLRDHLARVANGEAFLLQAGDCAESFADHSADSVRDRLKVLLQMAAILTYAGGLPIVKVARMAGQFAKPRSSPTELVGDVEISSFFGHMVNSESPDAASRVPDPSRLLAGYHHSSATLNLVRAFTSGGFADLTQVHAWNQQFIASSPQGQRYEALANEIDRALAFMRACGVDTASPSLHQVDIWTSHEALLLDYEEALTRTDSITGEWYDCSAHMLWIGERTRDPDGAHVRFLAGVRNPIGVKIGPSAAPADVKALCEVLDPEGTPGRLTLITRMGAGNVGEKLPPILDAVGDHPVVWACDPMHGNTFTSTNGKKTRHFNDIVTEVDGFFAAHRDAGTRPGGIHLEITGEHVTECLGGSQDLTEADLESAYTTLCDPRLNAPQSLDLAFHVAEMLAGNR